ncbi:MAG: type II toxin-antitoxin system VapC family toxin [Planctomycetes bacterium]|nr:type II toxin-antitoxin system VapC family toxin [Planctomycetota bacterium]
MQYLLDTNTCIDVMRNHPAVVHKLSALSPGDCVISTITSYELYTGVAKCASPDREQAKVALLLRTVVELPFDQAAGREAGRLRALLETAGEMIGPYDILLAGQALVAGLTLVTANIHEFRRVPGLTIENWQVESS